MRGDADSIRNVWLNPIDEPEDLRPVCNYCLRFYNNYNNYNNSWCSTRCSILDNIGKMKLQVVSLINSDLKHSYAEIIKNLIFFGWFDGVSTHSTDRWLRAIWSRIKMNNIMLDETGFYEIELEDEQKLEAWYNVKTNHWFYNDKEIGFGADIYHTKLIKAKYLREF